MMNLIGNIYGNLLVIEKLGRINKRTIYKCSCSAFLLPYFRIMFSDANSAIFMFLDSLSIDV